MALREFTAADGRRWIVWSTIPDWSASVPKELHAGWLTFESDGRRKRLSPIPRGWEHAPDDRLQLYCGAAESLFGARRSNPRLVDPNL
jgi:hypothetical protein